MGIQLLLVGTALAQEPYLRGVDDLKLFEPSDFSLYGNYKQVNEGWFGSIEALAWTISEPSEAVVGNPNVAPFAVFSGASSTQNTGNFSFVPATNPLTPGSALYQGFPSLPNPGFSGPGLMLNSPFQSSSSTTGWMKSSLQSGTRYEFGYIENSVGWMMSFIQLNPTTQRYVQNGSAINFANSPIGFIRGTGTLNGQTVSFDRDLDNDGVFGRDGRDWGTNGVPGTVLDGVPDPEPTIDFQTVTPGPNGNNNSNTVTHLYIASPPIPIDYDDIVSLPTVFNQMSSIQKNWLWGNEFMGVYRLDNTKRFRNLELLGGVRYLSVRDIYNVAGYGGTLGGSYWNTYTKNNIVGPQIGARWTAGYNRFQFGTEGRIMAGANFQNIRQDGQINVDSSFASTVNLPASQNFANADNAVEFAPVGEIRANLIYRVFRKVNLTAGYTLMGGSGVTRSSNRIEYTLPSMGITDTNRIQNFFINGGNFGVEINR